MKRRLLSSAFGIALLAVSLLGVPLALLARHQVFAAERNTLQDQAAGVASSLEDRLDARQSVDLQSTVRQFPNREFLVVSRGGRMVAHAGSVAKGSVTTATSYVAGFSITLRTAAAPVRSRAQRVTLLVIGIALSAVAGAMVLALVQARRIAAPLVRLVAHAEALGRGDFATRHPASGLVETDELSRVLEESAARLGRLLKIQREFASDAAHQLRTPLTGIALRLEEIEQLSDEHVATEAADALDQVERLNDVITSLLARSRDQSEDARILDLSELVERESALCGRVLAMQQRSLSVRVEQHLTVLGRPEHLRGVLHALLENAIVHGGTHVDVLLRAVDGTAELRVRDDGAGIAAALRDHLFDRDVSGAHGTGIGLALARSLATSGGGDLRLADARGAEFVFQLPLLR